MKLICAASFVAVVALRLWVDASPLVLLFGIPLAFFLVATPLTYAKGGISPLHEVPNFLRVLLSCAGGLAFSSLSLVGALVGVVLLAAGILANDESLRRVYRQRGLIVLSGIDGTGKSTHSTYIAELLRGRGLKCKVVRFHKYLFLDALSNVRLKLSEEAREKVRSMDIPAKTSRFSFVRPYLALVDNLILYAIEVLPSIWRGEFVVCDRFIWDNYVKHKALGYNVRFLKKLSMIVKPKVGFILDLKPEKAVERVSRRAHHYQYREEHYEIERNEFLDIGKKLGFAVVNTDRPMEETRKAIRDYLWRRLEELKWT